MRSGRDYCKTRRRDGKEKEEEKEEEKEAEKEAATNIKSNNPHLAGGEKSIPDNLFWPIGGK